ncbi:CaiB/BaiF CoA-transferase family protein [Bordetella sp. BOR01]|uniref:CaiB/BaiF CoA transferase family protein n=1 Tax=Bordetella sp. BOR01 TaxID=2854779 RepID=UPI001C47AEFF|nr:CaiB/BaiF CoA-transferase family protein [Bordetella sp. BOR01]MBV7483311.1 CoA transferase [Bordetella sp. BOR01]
MGALSGLRVLDLSRVLAGPWCAQTLADLGAEVVKVERTGMGDDTRAWGPPWRSTPSGVEQDSAYFLSANRNKKSVAVDFSRPEGAALVRDMATRCDVLIENFKVGSLARYGLSHEDLAPLNPGLVYCSITGFGQQGPYAQRAGYDFLIQGMGGLMSITGVPDGLPGAGPQKVGVALTDLLTGMYAATGILAAVMESRATGQGQHLDVALLDVQIASLANQAMNYLVGGKAPGRLGNAHPNIVPYQDFRTRDGYMILAVGNDLQFKRFCQACGQAQWADDARFATNPARIAHRDDLVALIAGAIARHDTAYWIETLEAAGVPCGPINTIAQAFADAQVVHRQAQVSIASAEKGDVPSVANPIRLSRTPVEYRHAPPGLGQDTRQVLGELLAMTPAEIDRLIEQRVVACS